MHLIARLKPAVAAREVSKVVPTSTAFLLQNWGSGCNCMPNRAMILNHYLCCTSVKYHIATIKSYPLVCKWSWESVFVKLSWKASLICWVCEFCLFSSTGIFSSHTYANQDNPKEKQWRRESSPFEVIWVGFTRGIGSWCVKVVVVT